MLSRIPSKLESLNKGLTTLQFQSLSVSPHNVNVLQGGTQDNGTWETGGNPNKWENTMIGDGGQSGFDVAIPEFRFHNFTGASPDVNFDERRHRRVDLDRSSARRRRQRVLHPDDQRSRREQDAVLRHRWTVYRTKTRRLGTRTIAEANAVCNEWTVPARQHLRRLGASWPDTADQRGVGRSRGQRDVGDRAYDG